VKKCNLYINPNPEHPNEKNDWYNYYGCVEETFRMAFGEQLMHLYYSLPQEQKLPKLEQWFFTDRSKKTIAVWGFAGYGKGNLRSPSLEWWNSVLKDIVKMGYTIFQFGSPNEPEFDLEKNQNYFRFNNKSFMDMVKISLGCDFVINTDSGSGWVFGAYGFPQISLIVNDITVNHHSNFLALAPTNWKHNEINLLSRTGADGIDKNEFLKAIGQLC
jgi:ADP-heptose:LPS heptosyltransferase